MLPAIVLIAVIGAAIFGGGQSADDPSNPQRPTADPGRTGGRGQPRPGCRGAPRCRLPGARAGPAGSFGRPDDGPSCRWRDPRQGRRRGRLVDGPTRGRLRPGRGGGPRRAVRHRRRLPARDRADRRRRARVRGPGRRGHPAARRRRRRGAASAGAARRVARHGRGRPARSGPRDPARARGRPRPVRRSPALGMPVLVVWSAVRHSPSSASSGSTAAGACASPRSTRPTSSRSRPAWSAGRSSIARSAAAQSC